MNWKNALLAIILLALLAGLIKTLGNINEGKKRLSEVESEVAQTVKQKENLEEEIKERESVSFLEQEARNQLNLVKPGERIVILPKKSEAGIGEEETPLNGTDSSKNEPNWVKWKRLFFD